MAGDFADDCRAGDLFIGREGVKRVEPRQIDQFNRLLANVNPPAAMFDRGPREVSRVSAKPGEAIEE